MQLKKFPYLSSEDIFGKARGKLVDDEGRGICRTDQYAQHGIAVKCHGILGLHAAGRRVRAIFCGIKNRISIYVHVESEVGQYNRL